MSSPLTRIQLRRGTAAAWTTANPTLYVGEQGYETDTGKQKVGDGSTPWTSLPYEAAKLAADPALRAAFVPGRVLNLSGAVVQTKRLNVVIDANGEIDDLIIEDVA